MLPDRLERVVQLLPCVFFVILAVNDALLDLEAFLALPLIPPLALPLFTGVVTA